MTEDNFFYCVFCSTRLPAEAAYCRAHDPAMGPLGLERPMTHRRSCACVSCFGCLCWVAIFGLAALVWLNVIAPLVLP